MTHYTKLNQALDQIAFELGIATGKCPEYPSDPLHALAILQMKIGELNKVTVQSIYEPHNVCMNDIKNEAMQATAMALRFFLSIDKYDYRPSEQHSESALDPAN